MTRPTVKSILKALACDKLKLYQGEDYWYFVYSDEEAKIFEDHSVMVPRLYHLTLESWIYEGKYLLNEVATKLKDRNDEQ